MGTQIKQPIQLQAEQDIGFKLLVEASAGQIVTADMRTV